MSRLYPFRFVTLLCLLSALAFAQSQIPGHWEGAIQLPGAPLAIQVDVKVGADGKLAATITIPAQGARDLPLTNFTTGIDDLSFDLPNVPGEPKFRGSFVSKDKILGAFTQSGQSFPCNLERKADPGTDTKAMLASLDALINDGLKKFDVPGMSIAVVKGKEIIYAKGFGYRDVEKQLPVTPDTLFAIGSCSKAFTTFVLGTLVDDGKVEWDQPVRTYIPWFRMNEASVTERLSVRDLVTHRSGLPRHDLVWYNNYDASREQLVRRLPYLELSADLRARFQYNNLMFVTAGYLTEVLTGKTWEAAVRERVFAPLDMQRTNFAVTDSQKDADFAYPYAKRDDKVVKLPFRPITNIGPAGSINSSANEMAHWVITHLNGGQYNGKRVAAAATVNELHQPQMATGAPSTRPDISAQDYGMGWFIDTYRGHQRVHHGGNIDGFSANAVLFPNDGYGIVVLTNLNGTPLRELIVRELADRLFKLEAVPWLNAGAGELAMSEAALKVGSQRKTVARVSGTQAAHKLDDYAGDYEHPGYGVLKVALREGKLQFTYNGINAPLEHWHYETFNALKGEDPTFEDAKLTFQTDANGNVVNLSALMEPSVNEIVFKKKPAAQWFEAAYLARFVGDYTLINQTISVSLRGNTLIAQAPGAPPQELIPGVDGGFTLKQSRAQTWYFTTDGQGQVTGIEVRQRGAVLNAKRKPAK
ncbi:MAG: serine hydrolase [Acidobacteria bacterium]|nr:serine hydrolase [Acidobacteriota bacterium]MBI3422742.1 serine hydrolase [Acidobacteriota bacterium]